MPLWRGEAGEKAGRSGPRDVPVALQRDALWQRGSSTMAEPEMTMMVNTYEVLRISAGLEVTGEPGTSGCSGCCSRMPGTGSSKEEEFVFHSSGTSRSTCHRVVRVFVL